MHPQDRNSRILIRLGHAIANACQQTPSVFRDLDDTAAQEELDALIGRLNDLTPVWSQVEVPDQTGDNTEASQQRGIEIEAFVHVYQVTNLLANLVHQHGMDVRWATNPAERLTGLMQNALLLASRCLTTRMSRTSADLLYQAQHS